MLDPQFADSEHLSYEDAAKQCGIFMWKMHDMKLFPIKAIKKCGSVVEWIEAYTLMCPCLTSLGIASSARVTLQESLQRIEEALQLKFDECYGTQL